MGKDEVVCEIAECFGGRDSSTYIHAALSGSTCTALLRRFYIGTLGHSLTPRPVITRIKLCLKLRQGWAQAEAALEAYPWLGIQLTANLVAQITPSEGAESGAEI